MRIPAISSVAAATLILTPAVASASPVNATEFEATISLDDLDLTTSDDVTRLDDRVRTRIRQLCQNGGRDGASLRLERECRSAAFATAERQVRLAVAEANADRARWAANSNAKGTDTPGA